MPTKNKFSVYEHFRGNEEFVKRMFDRVERTNRTFQVVYTPFLTSAQQEICTQILGKQVLYKMDGGYEQAEYKCLALCPDVDTFDEVKMPIVCLCASFSMKYGKITHRDVLGALMNLGMRREQFGDILIQEENIYIFVNRDNSSFVQLNCTKVAHFTIQFKPYTGTLNQEIQIQYRSLIVTSLRLDVLVSAIANLSRAKAQALIRSKLVKVDHQILEDCSYLCNNNCILSIRGYGRFCLKYEHKTTKKGNLVVQIGIYV